MSPRKKVTRLGYCPDCGRDMESDFCHHCGKEHPEAVRVGKKSVFVRGERFKDFTEMMQWIESGEWVYWPSDSRAKHPSVILSMTINTVKGAVMSGHIVRAIRR